ncbi:MAG: hypothetical protein ABSA39_18480 [Edaphobacter sp.]
MLKNSQTKVIVPIILLGLLEQYLVSNDPRFTDAQIRRAYEAAVKEMKTFLGHDVHIGAKYYDAYGSRMSRYAVLEQIAHLEYRLLSPYTEEARELIRWIPQQIKLHIDKRLGVVPLLHDSATRAALADSPEEFSRLIKDQIDKNPANFEIFTFAVIKVHLERFACKIYRDTRTASHDKGVDISTNFGVVYQIKKLRIHTQAEAALVYAELKVNFDNERLQDGSVILVIDDISKEVKQYLINMRVQSISKDEVFRMAANFDEPEDRQKVLRIIYEEFRREYSSNIT